MSKYNSKKAKEQIGDMIVTFDSQVERSRYLYLKTLENSGVITCLELQPSFVIREGYIRHGKKIREEKYRGDFFYLDSENKRVVEDVKGQRLPLYISKVHRLLQQHPELRFIEVYLKKKQWVEKEL